MNKKLKTIPAYEWEWFELITVMVDKERFLVYECSLDRDRIIWGGWWFTLSKFLSEKSRILLLLSPFYYYWLIYYYD